jgi:hypothetical protein
MRHLFCPKRALVRCDGTADIDRRRIRPLGEAVDGFHEKYDDTLARLYSGLYSGTEGQVCQ